MTPLNFKYSSQQRNQSRVIFANIYLDYFSLFRFTRITVKAFVVTPQMTKNSIIFRGGYDKGYKIFYSR